jgi:glycine cleavage system H protein
MTDFGQSEMGDIKFIDLPELEDDLTALEPFGIIESDSIVADMISPISGHVVGVNFDMAGGPDLINEDPYEEGWIVRVLADDQGQADSLMTADEYVDYITDLVREEE